MNKLLKPRISRKNAKPVMKFTPGRLVGLVPTCWCTYMLV